MIPGSIHPLLAGKSEYKISNSLRFRASASARLTRTYGATGSSQKFTGSVWIKRGILGSAQSIFGAQNTGAATWDIFTFNASDQLQLFIDPGTTPYNVITTAVFRDPSAWYHVVFSVDTTQATAANRVRIYVNNVEQSLGTNTIPQNYNLRFNVSGNTAGIGTEVNYAATTGPAKVIDGYFAEINWVDGQQLTPSSFGQTDAATGVWVPKKYSGSYGNNGFYLKFADASAATAAAIGKDSSGNGNNWTPSGISVTSGTTFDQMTDSPTLNYAVWSPIDRGDTGLAVTNGNLGYTISNAVSGLCRATFAASTGKWYWEMTAGADWTASPQHGISPVTASNTGDATAGNGYGWESAATSRLFANGAAVSNYGTQISNGDVLMIAVDFDAGKIWYGRNGTWFGSPAGDPAAGTNQSQTITTGVVYAPMFGRDSSNATTTNYVNFGQRAFAYTPPTGFKALNTANLLTPSIKKGSLYMDATLRTGTGATASVSSLSFAPDLVWIKSRLSQTTHNLFDSVRTATNGLILNATTAEFTDSNTLTAFNSNGYSLGSDASSRGVNVNAASYVDWAWKEAVSSGFDIVSYAGDNTSNRNISHSLGVAPKFAIVKSRGTSNVWMWHANLTGNTSYIILNGLAVQTTTNTPWGTGNWSSTQFMVTNNATENANAASTNYIAYLWSEVDGFSKFGYYDGNASTDGPFVWCGFRPRFVFMRYATGTNAGAFLRDSVRDPVNTAVKSLAVGYTIASAETDFAANELDLLSNGFKLRSASGGAGTGYTNYASTSYVFAAFAENPFKYARAR